MFGETRETETVLGPVIQAGMEALKVITHINFTPMLDHLLSFTFMLYYSVAPSQDHHTFFGSHEFCLPVLVVCHKKVSQQSKTLAKGRREFENANLRRKTCIGWPNRLPSSCITSYRKPFECTVAGKLKIKQAILRATCGGLHLLAFGYPKTCAYLGEI